MIQTFTAVKSPKPACSWIKRAAPCIATKVPHSVFRAMTAAMRAVDRDIEQHGAVTYETVEQVRSARALLATF